MIGIYLVCSGGCEVGWRWESTVQSRRTSEMVSVVLFHAFSEVRHDPSKQEGPTMEGTAPLSNVRTSWGYVTTRGMYLMLSAGPRG